MCDAIAITIQEKFVTDEFVERLIHLDSIGRINLDRLPIKQNNKTWLETFKDTLFSSKENISGTTANMYGISEQTEESIVCFGADGRMDSDDFLKEFKDFGIDIRVFFESCDGFNATELFIFSDGTHILYDVDTDGHAIIQADSIHYIRNYPPKAFKAVVLDLLEQTNFNTKVTTIKPFNKMLKKHEIANVLDKLDEGDIGIGEALSMIKDLELNDYMVFIDASYCDGQAYINKPDGEFGGDGYVELSSTYPICVGTYRGKSEDEAIRIAASQMQSNEEIFYAVQIQK